MSVGSAVESVDTLSSNRNHSQLCHRHDHQLGCWISVGLTRSHVAVSSTGGVCQRRLQLLPEASRSQHLFERDSAPDVGENSPRSAKINSDVCVSQRKSLASWALLCSRFNQTARLIHWIQLDQARPIWIKCDQAESRAIVQKISGMLGQPGLECEKRVTVVAATQLRTEAPMRCWLGTSSHWF